MIVFFSYSIQTLLISRVLIRMAGHILKVDLVHEYQQSSPQPYLSANSQLLFIEVSSWKLGKEKLPYVASFNL